MSKRERVVHLRALWQHNLFKLRKQIYVNHIIIAPPAANVDAARESLIPRMFHISVRACVRVCLCVIVCLLQVSHLQHIKQNLYLSLSISWRKTAGEAAQIEPVAEARKTH